MIRRSMTLKDGSPGWLLISQQDHARLAAKLASQWASLPRIGSHDDYRNLLWAIRHHDDGWQDWDRHWYVNRAQGVPIAFHEMDPADSNRIWQDSIDAVQSHGPLVSYIVAQHFVRMRQRSSSEDPTGSSSQFIDHNQRRCESWLDEWAALPHPKATPNDLPELAVEALQFFDNLSLILCLGELDGTIELSPPVPPAVTLCLLAPWQGQFRPNPLSTPTSVLRTEALELPARDQDAKRMKRSAVPRQLSWSLSGELT